MRGCVLTAGCFCCVCRPPDGSRIIFSNVSVQQKASECVVFEMRRFCCILILFYNLRLIDADCNVVTRKDWGGVNPHHVEYLPRPVDLVIIQHTETPWCSTLEQCKKSIKNIQANTVSLYDDDVGYSFVIGGDGKVYEGLGWLRVGSRAIGFDRKAIGIGFIGNYNKDTPTTQQLESLRALLKCGVDVGHLTPDFHILAHRQVFLTESPGEKLYIEIKKWPQWMPSIDKITASRSLIMTQYAIDLGIYDPKTGHLDTSGLHDQIYTAVVNKDYYNAVDLSVVLDKFGGDNDLTSVVNKLLTNGEKNVMEYAYRLWNYGGQNVITKHFPIQFQMILNEEPFKLSNNKDDFALKMGTAVDNDGDKDVYGDGKDKRSYKLNWKLIPIWEGNMLYFKFLNVESNRYLKMGVKEDNIGDRNVYGSTNSDSLRHQWYLQPKRVGYDVLFLIYNRVYNQALKLARAQDGDGDRLLWGHKELTDDAEEFGWRIFH